VVAHLIFLFVQGATGKAIAYFLALYFNLLKL